MPEIDHEVVEKFEFFVVFDTITGKLLKDFVIRSNTINSMLCIKFFEAMH